MPKCPKILNDPIENDVHVPLAPVCFKLKRPLSLDKHSFQNCGLFKISASFLARFVGILHLALSPVSRFCFYSKRFAMFTRFFHLLHVAEKL